MSSTGIKLQQTKVWVAPASADTIKNPFRENMEASLAKGKGLYIQYCSICHGVKGKGDGIAGAGLNPRPADHSSEKVQSQTDGALYWKMTTGRPPMASYEKDLTAVQRWQLVCYIRTLRKGAVAKVITAQKENIPSKKETASAPWVAPAWADTLKNLFPGDESSIAKGKGLYLQYCTVCHGEKGKGDGPGGINFEPRPADHTSEKVQSQSDGAFFWKMTNGRAPMPVHKQMLTNEQQWHLVNYIRTLKKGTVQKEIIAQKESVPVKPETGLAEWKAPSFTDTLKNPFQANDSIITAGKGLYGQYCTVCHGDYGKGDGPGGINFDPRPADHTSEKVQSQSDGAFFWKMTNGRAPMPVHSQTLTSQQLWALVIYIRTLKSK